MEEVSCLYSIVLGRLSMSFQLTRTHTSVVLAATTIAASLVVIPSLAEGTNTSQNAFCASIVSANARISAEYDPLLASYAAAVAGHPTASTVDPAREAQLRQDLADAQAALESGAGRCGEVEHLRG